MTAVHAFLALALQASPAQDMPIVPGTPPPGTAAAPAAPMPAPPPPASFPSIVRDARAKLEAGDFAGAAERYAEALRARPDASAAAYNQGVALYRDGKYADAARAFAQAAEIASEGAKTDPLVEARSTYNKAASHYRATKAQAEAAERMIESEDTTGGADAAAPATEPVDPEALKAAIEDAQKSLQGFKDAALNDPADRDARANAQQSLRLLRALQELQKQQQQQERQPQRQQDQPSGGTGGGTGDDEGDDADGGQGSSSPRESGPPDGEQDAPPQPAEQQPPPKPSRERPGEMTKQEADRLLQAVRDRERERRADQERAAAVPRNRRPPAKDW